MLMRVARLSFIVAVAVVLFAFTFVAGVCVAFLLAGWLHSMMMDDPVRQFWQPRLDRLDAYFLHIVVVAWALLFGVAWRFSSGLRGTRRI